MLKITPFRLSAYLLVPSNMQNPLFKIFIFKGHKIGDMFYQSGIEVEDLNTRCLRLYLAVNRTPVQLRAKGLVIFVQ